MRTAWRNLLNESCAFWWWHINLKINKRKGEKSCFEDSSRSLCFEKLLRFNYRETQWRIMCYWNNVEKLMSYNRRIKKWPWIISVKLYVYNYLQNNRLRLCPFYSEFKFQVLKSFPVEKITSVFMSPCLLTKFTN